MLLLLFFLFLFAEKAPKSAKDTELTSFDQVLAAAEATMAASSAVLAASTGSGPTDSRIVMGESAVMFNVAPSAAAAAALVSELLSQDAHSAFYVPPLDILDTPQASALPTFSSLPLNIARPRSPLLIVGSPLPTIQEIPDLSENLSALVTGQAQSMQPVVSPAPHSFETARSITLTEPLSAVLSPVEGQHKHDTPFPASSLPEDSKNFDSEDDDGASISTTSNPITPVRSPRSVLPAPATMDLSVISVETMLSTISQPNTAVVSGVQPTAPVSNFAHARAKFAASKAAAAAATVDATINDRNSVAVLPRLCSECLVAAANVHCADCVAVFCDACNIGGHASRTMSEHVRRAITVAAASTEILAKHTSGIVGLCECVVFVEC